MAPSTISSRNSASSRIADRAKIAAGGLLSRRRRELTAQLTAEGGELLLRQSVEAGENQVEFTLRQVAFLQVQELSRVKFTT